VKPALAYLTSFAKFDYTHLPVAYNVSEYAMLILPDSRAGLMRRR